MTQTKGSCSAPLFFVALALAVLGSRYGHASLWATSAAAMGLAGRTAVSGSAISPFSIAVWGYAAWAALHTLFISPAYTPAGLYHPLLLVLGFGFARRSSAASVRHAAMAACALGAILAGWGLVQVGPLGFGRARAIFETPATYAAVLNLLLVPALAAVAAGRRDAWLLGLAGLLAGAVFAGDSRGGYLAFAGGMGALLILGRRGQLWGARGLAGALGVVAAGCVLALAWRSLPWPSFEGAMADAPLSAESRAASALSRLELLDLSWSAWRERPVAGTGYLTFRYALERDRVRVPSYGESNQTAFAHNDYLQTLQELGPIGLAGLLALVLTPAWLAYRRIPRLPVERRAPAAAAAAGLATMACHALVDFPFYIPACLLLYGALCGVLERQLAVAPLTLAAPLSASPLLRAARTAAALIAGLVLLRPVAAETAAEWGMKKFAAGDGPAAARWLAAAQRIDPGDWRFHWYAGQFWEAQTAAAGKREAARLAAQAYAAGFAANPLEVANLLGMISVHRRYAGLLDAPAGAAALREWVGQAEALAPFNGAVRRERALLGAVP